jgi:NAD(P)-dependent dehydrogenase (short-subunit alcohol dehydrogenase family)
MAKTVFITGASSGIGQATDKLFLARGWNVAATARDPLHLPTETTPRRIVLRVDVNDESTIAAAVAAALQRFGSIDVLVNNAGYGIFGPLEAIPSAQLTLQLQTNVVGVAAVIRQVLPSMRQRRSGVIINVSSVAGRIAVPFQSAYHASKFALEGLSESLRFELEVHGIRVKIVEPAHFKTDFVSRSLQWVKHRAYEPYLSYVINHVSDTDRRAPSCEPVAEAIFRAAVDSSGRLRYPVKGNLFRLCHALVPDAIWQFVLRTSTYRS